MSEKQGNDSELQAHIRELLTELSDVTRDRDKHLQKLLQEIITILRMNGFRFVYIGGGSYRD